VLDLAAVANPMFKLKVRVRVRVRFRRP